MGCVHYVHHMYQGLISCKNMYDQVWRKQIECQRHFEKAKFFINNFENKRVLEISKLLRFAQK